MADAGAVRLATLVTRRGNRDGTIARRSDGRWAAAVEVEGRRRWVYGRTRQEVTRKLQEAIRGVEMGLVPVGDRRTVGQYLERWLEESARRRLRPKTYRGYEQLIRLHLVPELGRVRLSKLGPIRFSRFSIGSWRRACLRARFSTCAPCCARPRRTRSDGD
jgi:hypothetical protein